ncbi:2350_t:CDS:1, partial [Entrophospora sp. SA101]
KEISRQDVYSCMAHKINLVFGDMFKENETFKRVSDETVHIFTNLCTLL